MAKLHAPVLLPAGSGRGFGGAFFLGLFAVLALMACLKYLALHSTVFDLGVFLSDLYSLHNSGQWWRVFLGHAQPLLLIYDQISRLASDQAAPLLLLTVQAFALALPAFWAAKRHGMLAALVYALYFPVWTNALSDFQLDHLLIPILFAFLAAATSERYGLAFVLGLLPALVREPYAATTVFCGLYLWTVARQTRAGWGLILFGAAYYYITTAWLIPFCTVETALGAASNGYAWLGGTPGSAVLTFVMHPGQVLAGAFGLPEKWSYLLALFGALLFFPIFRPKLLLPAIPALALALFSTQPNAYDWTNHYTAGAAGVLFFAFCEVLGPVRILARQSKAGATNVGAAIFLSLALCHVLLAPSPLSRFFLATDNFAFSAEAYEPTARDAAILAEILKSIPSDPTVPVVSQNTLNWSTLARRFDYASFPLGVFEPHPERDLTNATWKDLWTFIRTKATPNLPVRAWQARYVLLDLTRPWFVHDRGCAFQSGACQDEAVAGEFNALVLRARQELETVYDQGGFLILRRPEPVPAPPAPAQTPASEQAPEGTSDQPPQAATDASPQTQTPAVPGAPPAPAKDAPPAAAKAPPAATAPQQPGPSAPAVQPAPAQDDEVQVEVLDRFPVSRLGKKPKTPATGQEGEAPAAGGPATPDATPALGPDAASPATEAPRPQTRRSRRQKEPTEIPAPQQPATGSDTAPSP
ncbi:MAG: DUF2079 domain-containing protein [Solidesulfovibrio sp.]